MWKSLNFYYHYQIPKDPSDPWMYLSAYHTEGSRTGVCSDSLLQSYTPFIMAGNRKTDCHMCNLILWEVCRGFLILTFLLCVAVTFSSFLLLDIPSQPWHAWDMMCFPLSLEFWSTLSPHFPLSPTILLCHRSPTVLLLPRNKYIYHLVSYKERILVFCQN